MYPSRFLRVAPLSDTAADAVDEAITDGAILASKCGAVPSADMLADWDRPDLVRRVMRALDFARAATNTLLRDHRFVGIGPPREKFVAETALLLYNIAPIAGVDPRIPGDIDEIASAILSLARSDEVRAAICLDPGEALDHACAHILLGAIGYRDDALDELLCESLKVEAAPERLPHRLLEQAWLRGLYQRRADPSQVGSVRTEGSMLTRPVDSLRASRFDFYGFTHAVMYASDFGATPPLLASAATVDASAVAGLAFALETLDYDLAAELLLTWPMLRLPWPPAAAIAFNWLARTEDLRGFLSGKSFDPTFHEALPSGEGNCYAVATCYHTVYVMAFLCASALRYDRPPQKAHLAGNLSLGGTAEAEWNAFAPLPDNSASARLSALRGRRQLEGIGPLLLTIALREAAGKGDMQSLRAALQIALDRELTDVLAVRQATELLRRTALLNKCLESAID